MTDHSPWMPPGSDRPDPASPPTLPDATHVAGPPPPSSPPPPPSPGVRPDDPSDDGVELGGAGTEPTGGRTRRSRWLVGGAVVAVLAVGAAGVFAVANLTASRGGASSPDDLGLDLLSAIEDEDVLGIIDVLAPGEREAFRDPSIDLVSELIRLGVLSEAATLADIAGIEIELTDESVRTESTNVDDIVNVSMRADVAVEVDGSELPIGDLLEEHLPPDVLAEMRDTQLSESDEFDVTMTAIEVDGRWYLSVFHTIAELARVESGVESGIPAEGVGSDGADDPEGAVDLLLDGIERLDITDIIRSLDPGEAAALQRYAPLFVEDAQRELDEFEVEIEITDRSFRAVGGGDTRTVVIDGIGVEGVADGVAFSFALDGDCVEVEVDGDTVSQCGGYADVLDEFDDAFGDMPASRQFVDDLIAAFDDIEEVGVEVRQRDGLWYVSPMATVTEPVLAVLRALDRDELDRLIESGSDAFDELLGAGPFSIEPFPDEPFPDEPGFGGDEDLACWGVVDVDEAIACFDDAVAAGEALLSEVPVQLRYPECGLAEPMWSGEQYSMSDEEFTATMEAAQPCFLELVDAGEIEEWELPDEITHLECYEGRNWYNIFDDPEYDDRVWECLIEPLGA